MARPSLKTVIELVAALGILAGGIAWWVRFDREVQARLTREQVEHVVDYKVNTFSSTFAEILRRLERIERQSDRNTEILLEDRQHRLQRR